MKNYNQSHTLMTPISGSVKEGKNHPPVGLPLFRNSKSENLMVDNLKFSVKRALNVKSYPSWLIVFGIATLTISFYSFISILYLFVIC